MMIRYYIYSFYYKIKIKIFKNKNTKNDFIY